MICYQGSVVAGPGAVHTKGETTPTPKGFQIVLTGWKKSGGETGE